MYKDVLRSISDVDIYPIISLLLFFLVFVYVIYRVVTAPKTLINEISALPLDDATDKTIKLSENE